MTGAPFIIAAVPPQASRHQKRRKLEPIFELAE